MATRVVLRQQEIDGLLRDQDIADLLLDVAAPAVAEARLRAPRRTGAGAASIRAESVLDGDMQTVRISWDRDHFYMSFQDVGTRYLPPLHFLEDSLEGLGS